MTKKLQAIFKGILILAMILPAYSAYAQNESEGGKKPSAIGNFEMPADIKENMKKNPSDLKKPKPSSEGSTTKKPAAGTAKPGTKPGTKPANGKGQAAANDKTQQPKATLNGKPVDPKKVTGKKTVTNTQGFRIQVFADGSNPATLQSRAKARGNMIVAKFPKYKGQIYSFSSSPNWYTRVGNFETQEQANKALAELKKAFPSFASEMRVVKSQIKIVK